jgi:hypothetical protein
MRLVLPFLLRMTRQWAATVWRRFLLGRCLVMVARREEPLVVDQTGGPVS